MAAEHRARKQDIKAASLDQADALKRQTTEERAPRCRVCVGGLELTAADFLHHTC